MAPIPSAIQTIGLTAGANFSAALCIDGSVWTWGLGSNGQAGQGSTVNIFVPTRIAGFSLVSNTAATNDTDGDGLADGIEWAIGTDPQLADTNGDGIDDGAALLLGQSPTTLDSDGDGLTDAQEAIIGTNPYLADTDRDGSNRRRRGNRDRCASPHTSGIRGSGKRMAGSRCRAH